MVEEASSSSRWSWEEEKAFETALAINFCHGDDGLWERIAAAVPGKTPDDVRLQYEVLLMDIKSIESGQVPLPEYLSEGSPERPNDGGGCGARGKKGGGHGSSSQGNDRRKGVAWSEEEHRLFLCGLHKYGKGDWRSISRNFVLTRTPTQVASHAQKYFNRLQSNKDRRRASIHDITIASNDDSSGPQRPITGQTSGATVTQGKPLKQSHSSVPPGVSVYRTTIGHPVRGNLISTIGTPVNLPVAAAPNMAYGLQAPAASASVPGVPMNLSAMGFPMPHASANI